MRQYLFPVLMLLAPLPATAEIKLTGDAKMGLSFDNQELKAVSAARITAHAYAETDGGLQYGVIVDLDLTNFSDEPRGQVYISGGNHSLAVGQGVKNAIWD